MPARRILTLCALLLALPSAASAMEKCVSPEGKVSYSEQPCAAGSKKTAVGGGTSAAAPTAEAVVRYYEVQGGDYASLLAALKSRGGFHGEAEWKLSYQVLPRLEGKICKVESVTTALELVMSLPRWSPPPGAPRDLVARWERYLRALRSHEEGHLRNGREFDDALKGRLSGLTARSCAALDRLARDHFSSMLEQYRTRDRDYDQQTGHGRMQGVEFR